MKGITITDHLEPIQLSAIAVPKSAEGECLVKIKAAALNRRDQWIREGKYPGIRLGTVLGSDGCGTVEEGPIEWRGKDVIINPNVNWGDNPEVQAGEYSVLGMPTNGTLAEYINVSVDRLQLKPDHLNFEEAAALPLAALTAYRSVMSKGMAAQGKRILVTGAGGGVSQFAIAFALVVGAEVFVTSGSQEKIDSVKKLGVTDGFNYHNEQWCKEASGLGGFDAIVDGAGGNQLNNYIKLIKPAGRIIMYGSTAGYPEKVDVFRLFWSQAQIMGSTMGNDQEFSEMLYLINRHQIRPTVDKVYAFADYLSAFNRFSEPEAFGKIVLKISN